MTNPAGLLFLLAVGTGSTSGIVIVEADTPAARSRALVEDIGIETLGGVFTPLLKRGCKAPCEVTESFSTAADGQAEISLTLFRGTAPLARKNHLLGKYVIGGLPPRPRGQLKVFVTLRMVDTAITIAAREETGAQISLRRSVMEEPSMPSAKQKNKN
jgi:molecular chaperone DnaK